MYRVAESLNYGSSTQSPGGGEQMYFYRARVILWSHIVPACDCQPSANSTLLVVASTVENFVLIHFMGKDRNLGARWLQ